MENIQIKGGHVFTVTWANTSFKFQAFSTAFSVDIVDGRFTQSGSMTSLFQEKKMVSFAAMFNRHW